MLVTVLVVKDVECDESGEETHEHQRVEETVTCEGERRGGGRVGGCGLRGGGGGEMRGKEGGGRWEEEGGEGGGGRMEGGRL